MVWKKVINGDTGDADHFGGDDIDKISDAFSGVDVDDFDINLDCKIRSAKLQLRNPANTFSYIVTSAAIAADRILNLPLLTATDTLVTEAFSQTLTNKTISGASNTISNVPDSALSSNVVREDIANSFGDFAQTFKDNQLKINNPADTFAYTIVASAIAAARNATLPLLTGDDEFVMKDFAQTLTNKTLTTPTINGENHANVTKVNTDSPYTITATDYVIRADATSGNITLNLPTAASIAGRIYTIIRKDILSSTNIVTIDGSGSETIDGLLTWKLLPGEKIVVQSDGTNWITLYHDNPAQMGYFFDKGSTDNRRYLAGSMGTSNGMLTSTTSPAADTLWALPFIVGKVTKFDTISFEITTLQASQNANAGIYYDNGNCYPGALMFNTGSISTGTTGVKDTTITSSLQIFQPGLYWLAWETSATTIQIRTLQGGTQSMGIFGFLNSNWGTSAAYGLSVADTYGATLPDPYPGSASYLTASPSVSVPVPAICLRAI